MQSIEPNICPRPRPLFVTVLPCVRAFLRRADTLGRGAGNGVKDRLRQDLDAFLESSPEADTNLLRVLVDCNVRIADVRQQGRSVWRPVSLPAGILFDLLCDHLGIPVEVPGSAAEAAVVAPSALPIAQAAANPLVAALQPLHASPSSDTAQAVSVQPPDMPHLGEPSELMVCTAPVLPNAGRSARVQVSLHDAVALVDNASLHDLSLGADGHLHIASEISCSALGAQGYIDCAALPLLLRSQWEELGPSMALLGPLLNTPQAVELAETLSSTTVGARQALATALLQSWTHTTLDNNTRSAILKSLPLCAPENYQKFIETSGDAFSYFRGSADELEAALIHFVMQPKAYIGERRTGAQQARFYAGMSLAFKDSTESATQSTAAALTRLVQDRPINSIYTVQDIADILLRLERDYKRQGFVDHVLKMAASAPTLEDLMPFIRVRLAMPESTVEPSEGEFGEHTSLARALAILTSQRAIDEDTMQRIMRHLVGLTHEARIWTMSALTEITAVCNTWHGVETLVQSLWLLPGSERDHVVSVAACLLPPESAPSDITEVVTVLRNFSRIERDVLATRIHAIDLEAQSSDVQRLDILRDPAWLQFLLANHLDHDNSGSNLSDYDFSSQSSRSPAHLITHASSGFTMLSEASSGPELTGVPVPIFEDQESTMSPDRMTKMVAGMRHIRHFMEGQHIDVMVMLANLEDFLRSSDCDNLARSYRTTNGSDERTNALCALMAMRAQMAVPVGALPFSTAELAARVYKMIQDHHDGRMFETENRRERQNMLTTLAAEMAKIVETNGRVTCPWGQGQRLMIALHGQGYEIPGEHDHGLSSGELLTVLSRAFAERVGDAEPSEDQWHEFYQECLERADQEFADRGVEKTLFVDQLNDYFELNDWSLPDGASSPELTEEAIAQHFAGLFAQHLVAAPSQVLDDDQIASQQQFLADRQQALSPRMRRRDRAAYAAVAQWRQESERLALERFGNDPPLNNSVRHSLVTLMTDNGFPLQREAAALCDSLVGLFVDLTSASTLSNRQMTESYRFMEVPIREQLSHINDATLDVGLDALRVAWHGAGMRVPGATRIRLFQYVRRLFARLTSAYGAQT